MFFSFFLLLSYVLCDASTLTTSILQPNMERICRMSDGPYCPFINNKRKLNIFPITPPSASESNLEKLKHFRGSTPSKPILLSDISQSYQSSIYENNAASYATDTVSNTMSITLVEQMSWWQMDFKTPKEIDGITFSYYEEIEKSKKDEKTDTILIVSSKSLPNSICEKVIDCNGVISAIESSQYNMPLRELTCSLTVKEIEGKLYEEYYCHVSFPIGITAKSIRFQHKNEGRIILNNLSVTQFQSTQPKMKLIEIRLGEGELTEEKIKDVLEKALEDMIENGEVPADKVENIKETIQNLVENNNVGTNGATVVIEKENSVENNIENENIENSNNMDYVSKEEQDLEEEKMMKEHPLEQQILEEKKKEEEMEQEKIHKVQEEELKQQQQQQQNKEEVKYVKPQETEEIEVREDYQSDDKNRNSYSSSEEKKERSETKDDENNDNDYVPSNFG